MVLNGVVCNVLFYIAVFKLELGLTGLWQAKFLLEFLWNSIVIYLILKTDWSEISKKSKEKQNKELNKGD